MKTIAVIDDDVYIGNMLEELLGKEGYGVLRAYSGTEALLLLERRRPDLVLLDLMLPGMTGEELITHIRRYSNMPVIVLSAKETGQDKVNALRLGADDYVTKPFDEEELLTRIEANLRRSGVTATTGRLTHKDVELDRDTHVVTVGGNAVSLTAREFAILELLLASPKKVFTKANIYQSVWNDAFFGDDNTVNVHISNLRAKLGGGYIQTVWGIGFKLED